MSTRVGEVTIAVIEIHKRLLTEALGNKIEESCGINLRLIEVALILLHLCNYLIIGEVSEINVLRDIIGGEDALKVDTLKKLDKLGKGEIVVIYFKFINGFGACLEHLELELVRDGTGLARLDNRLVEYLGNGYGKRICTVNDADIDMVGNDSCNLADLIISAADDTGEGEVVAAVIGCNDDVVGKTHLIVAHICDLTGHGKIEDQILDSACLKNVISVLTKGTEDLSAVNINRGDVIDDILFGKISNSSISLNVVLKLIERDLFSSVDDLIQDILDLLLADVHKGINVRLKGDGDLILVI